jgi:iron complex outermembrane receptor protein
VNANVHSVNQFNPLLKPFLADQVDVSLEYYSGKSGLVSAAVFYKDLKNFIVNGNRTQTLMVTQEATGVTAPEDFRFFLPVNGTNGKIKGLEVGAQVPSTFLPSPFDGFGVPTSPISMLASSRLTMAPQASSAGCLEAQLQCRCLL